MTSFIKVESPDEPGFYWARYIGIFTIVKVTRDKDGLSVFRCGSDDWGYIQEFSDWHKVVEFPEQFFDIVRG